MTTHEPLTQQNSFEAFDAQYAAKLALGSAGVSRFAADLYTATLGENEHVGVAVASYRSLYERGGKRTRTALAATGYEMHGGQNPDVIATAAAVIEAMHAYLLVFDDVADAADLRRNNLTAHVSLQRYFQTQGATGDIKKLGEDVAENAAQYAHHKAQALLLRAPAPPEWRVNAGIILNEGLALTGLGQILDIVAARCPGISEEDMHTIATRKTAWYSYLLPLQIGGALAGAPLEELEYYRDYSLHAGFGYQMRDDIIGIFSDEATTGKSRKSDIVEGKKTLLMHDALTSASDNDRRILQDALGNPGLSDQHFEQCLTIITETGALARAETLAEESAQLAAQSLDTVPSHWPIQQVQFLRDMAWYGVRRKA